jgi:two-component system NtrC family sensor kinase
VKIGRAVRDLLAQLGTAASMEDELRQTLQRLLGISGAVAGLLAFPSGGAGAIVVTAKRAAMPDALDDWLRQRLAMRPARGLRLARVVPPDVGRTLVELRAPLASRRNPGGHLLLVGRLRRASLPAALQGELGGALARVWRLHRGARETRALLEAGRAVTASLDVQETIRVIMTEARSVLGVESCSLMTFDPATEELMAVASLDLPQEMVTKIRLREGEGIAGRAVSERRPVQSTDLYSDARVRYPDLARTSGFRSMLAAPLRVGQRAIGAITVLRRDVHRFSADEEELLLAFADQAAIALEHARLYQQLEGMVAARTRELDAQKRFVEVVLETLPLGVFVLDAGLRVVRGNREGGRVLACGEPGGRSLGELVPAARGESLRAFLEGALTARRVESLEDEMVIGGETKILRLTAAPIEPAVEHLVLLVEEVTLAKRLERQMLLTERLTTAGRLAAGVAHELNNPLATIAGCAESLLARTREGVLARTPEIDDFRHYLGLIEEETYRCKEITGSLLQFVREPGSRRGPTDLNALVLKTIELLSHQSRFGGRRFATELDPELPAVTANEGQLRQVFLGIAANALEAMDSDGTLRIRSRRRRGEIEVELEDEGPGIPDEILGRIFDPFFTTKPPGQGTGLGLAIAQGIVTDHGGRLEVTSRVGKGSIFRVVLPA